MVDYSASDSASIPSDADLYAATIVPQLGPADALAVLPIDDGSVQEPQRIVDINLSRVAFALPADGVAHADEAEANRRRAYLDSASSTIRLAIIGAAANRRRFARQTDILGAIQHVARNWGVLRKPTLWARIASGISGDPVYATKRVLVIASDMIQEGGGLDFSRSAPQSVRAVEVILDNLRAAGELPDLTGIDVIVSGATGGSAIQVGRIRTFWTRYFAAANARVIAYDFDARSATEAYFGHAASSIPSVVP